MSLDTLDWPLGRPDRLAHGAITDLEPTDHLLTYPKTSLYFTGWGPVRAKVSMMIVEPDAIHRKHLRFARLFHRRFHRILTKSAPLMAAIPNGRRFVFGWTMIDDPDAVDTAKTRMTSLIASAKRDLEGHKLRHLLVAHINSQNLAVDVMGRGYKPFDRKEDGLAPYRYSLVIENVREPSLFTEKLIDALICRTVPIYCGAPDIADFLDTSGMIICNSFDDLTHALTQVSEADYAARAAAIETNRTRALDYAQTHARAARLLLDEGTR